MNPKKVVTRFAPSPTGFMHVGGVRTAIYAWLFARQNNGTFILRIEDTDKEREVAGSIEHIQESLQWLGLTWDQGPILQSSRLEHYKKYALQLVEKGFAYPDPFTEEEVEVFRKKAEEEKRPFLYRDRRPEKFDTWDGKKTLRFKVPEVKRYVWNDLVRGELSAGEEALDDFILIKSDGYPTYNFAHIIDDLEMDVTHIMRGEEFISSTPKFLSLYDALGIKRPEIATMPVILGPDGKKKLSKRDGAKDILEYRNEGYLPEAMLNFLAFLGWNPGGEKEVMTVDELISAFDFDHVQKGGAKFDETKLKWFNHEHIKLLSDTTFAEQLAVYMQQQKKDTPSYVPHIIPLLKERAETLGDVAQGLSEGEYSFMDTEPTHNKELLLKSAKAEAVDIALHFEKISNLLGAIADEDFTSERVKEAIFPYATEVGRSAVLWPLRVALSGREKSPDPFTLCGLLGKEVVLSRIQSALAVIK